MDFPYSVVHGETFFLWPFFIQFLGRIKIKCVTLKQSKRNAKECVKWVWNNFHAMNFSGKLSMWLRLEMILAKKRKQLSLSKYLVIVINKMIL